MGRSLAKSTYIQHLYRTRGVVQVGFGVLWLGYIKSPWCKVEYHDLKEKRQWTSSLSSWSCHLFTKAMDIKIQEAWIQGYIWPWTLPLLFHLEKRQSLWLCIDYRRLVPSPLAQRGQIFKLLDLCSAYNLVCIQGWRMEMAFGTSVCFQYCFIIYTPFSGPSVFLCLINDALHDILGKFVIVYIEDILGKKHTPTVSERSLLSSWRTNSILNGRKVNFRFQRCWCIMSLKGVFVVKVTHTLR